MTVLRLCPLPGTDPHSSPLPGTNPHSSLLLGTDPHPPSPSCFVLEGLYQGLLPPCTPLIAFSLPGLARAPEPFCSRGELIDFKKLILLYRIISEPG